MAVNASDGRQGIGGAIWGLGAKVGRFFLGCSLGVLALAWAPAVAAPAGHWAFQPPQRPSLPVVQNRTWSSNPIDTFVLARLEREGLTPAVEADRSTLIRRLSLDLIGLPPAPWDVEAFEQDEAPGAYRRLVDRLLASPQYGERWGRHWLDLARYADSNGYSIDAPRSIWPYRDWVINAFNRDLSFDRFTIEQLAGDLLPEAGLEEQVATGFHRNTQINQEGGIDPEQFRIESIFDRVDTTGAVWLGLTIGCAQCHDHKFDPIKQREYYELFAFFNNCDEPTLDIAEESERARRDDIRREIRSVERELKRLKKEDPDRAELDARVRELRRAEPDFPSTLVLRERKEPRPTHVFVKGDFTRLAEPVSPGVPAVLPGLPEVERPNRLDLARWLVDRANPLTARVTVNRIWQQYFGRGLVETENDFGTQGSVPSHPELLDWLATEFMAQGWSFKAMHRLIVTSATYRQSSRRDPAATDPDPRNLFLARQNRLRLDAEGVRDVGLSASGLLSLKLGGPGVFPPQPDGVMTLGQSRRSWRADLGEDRYRRGLYTFFWRATPHPMLAVFDAPDAFSTCTRRIRSNTPLQALTMLNDEACFEFAQQLAVRVLREAPPRARDRLVYACRLCLGRSPDPAELGTLHQLLDQQIADFDQAPEGPWRKRADRSEIEAGELAAWTSVGRVLLNLDETITRE